MKITTGRIVLLAVVLFLTAGWIWRYATLNAYYDSLVIADMRYERYELGDMVSFEDPDPSGGTVEGYSIRVDRFEVVEPGDLDPAIYARSDMATSQRGSGKIALVYVTLFNAGGDAPGVMLNSLPLHGIDALANTDWNLLRALNPILEGGFGIALSPGTECSVVLPYDLYRDVFYGDWNRLDRYAFYLELTAFPTEKEIRVQ